MVTKHGRVPAVTLVLCPETSFLIHTSEGLLSAPAPEPARSSPSRAHYPEASGCLASLTPLTRFAQACFLLSYLVTVATTFSLWFACNPTPPHLITQGPLPEFCPEQQTHLPQGFDFLTPRYSLLTALGPESRQWPPGQALRVHADHETAPPVPRPLHLPVKGSDRASAGPSTFITLGEALCLFKGD